MIGKKVEEYSFRNNEQVIPLSHNTALKIKYDLIYIDPQLIFQRLNYCSTRNDNLVDVFQYVLCSYPSALFENRTTPRLATKSALADVLCKLMPPDLPITTCDV